MMKLPLANQRAKAVLVRPVQPAARPVYSRETGSWRVILEANLDRWRRLIMQDLRVIGVENGALLVSSDAGERFRIPIDEVLQSRLRQAVPDTSSIARKLSPREIQEQIRSGMSAADVAAVTGMPVEHIEKYEGPILAEREHIVEIALDVPVHTALDTGPVAGGVSFGTAIRGRLGAINALNERWASWKDPATGWVVKLSFTADQIDHDARWKFDPRRLALSPLNSEATTLSQQGDVPAQLVPRLRAVAPSALTEPEGNRFDSGAFAPVAPPAPVEETPSRFAPRPLQADSNQTADLLDALRRRRGEREAAPMPTEEEARSAHPSTGSIRIVDVPMPPVEPEPVADEQRPTLPQPTVAPVAAPAPKRKGRTAMPSWDDIVFGARADDDPA
jgi:hypothetical protein